MVSVVLRGLVRYTAVLRSWTEISIFIPRPQNNAVCGRGLTVRPHKTAPTAISGLYKHTGIEPKKVCVLAIVYPNRSV